MSKELLLLTLYIAVIAFLLLTRKTRYFIPAAIALFFGVIWTLTVGDVYSYNVATVTVLGVNTFALIGWSLGLLVGYILYTRAIRHVKQAKMWQRLLMFNIIYIPLLLLLETIAYHLLNVVNVGTSTYAGLPVCDCIHAPAWMQASYLFMGTAYFLVVQLVLRQSRSVAHLSEVQTSRR